MGIANSVASWLISCGYDAVHLNDENLYRLSDKNILEKALKEQRIILTSDMDFGHMLAIGNFEQASVIQFRTTSFTPSNVIEKLQLVFDRFADEMNGGFIITVEDKRVRYRRLPI